MRTRIIELSANDRKEVIQLPINPSEIAFTDPQNNQQVTLLDVGSVNLLGERGLISVTFESFFPAEKSPLYFRGGANRTPKEYKAMVKKWKDNKSVVRMIITALDINLAMSVDSFEYKQREGDDDIYYSIVLTEYKTLNVPTVKVSTKDVYKRQHLGRTIICSAGLEKGYCSHNNLPLLMDEEDA